MNQNASYPHNQNGFIVFEDEDEKDLDQQPQQPIATQQNQQHEQENIQQQQNEIQISVSDRHLQSTHPNLEQQSQSFRVQELQQQLENVLNVSRISISNNQENNISREGVSEANDSESYVEIIDNVNEEHVIRSKKKIRCMQWVYSIFMSSKILCSILGTVAIIEYFKTEYTDDPLTTHHQKLQQIGILFWLLLFDLIEMGYYVNLIRYCSDLQKNFNGNHILYQDLSYSESIIINHLKFVQQQSCIMGVWMGRAILVAELMVFLYISTTQVRVDGNKREYLMFTNEIVCIYLQYSMLFCEVIFFIANILQIVFILYILYAGISFCIKYVYKQYRYYKLSKYLQGEKLPDFVRYYRSQVIAYNQQIEDPQQCPICLMQYEQQDFIVNVKCQGNHHFHSECVKSWIKSNMNCPICRQVLTVNNFIA